MVKLPKEAEVLIGPVDNLEKARNSLTMLLQGAEPSPGGNKSARRYRPSLLAQRNEGSLPRELMQLVIF